MIFDLLMAQGAATVSTWTPLELFKNSEQGTWYDPSDLSTLFQDIAGTIPVTAAGQNVGKVLDKSGRGNHLTADTTASRPIFQTDGTYFWLEFDGVNGLMSTPTITVNSINTISGFCGAKNNASPSVWAGVACNGNISSTDGAWSVFYPSSPISTAGVHARSSSNTLNSVRTAGTTSVLTWIVALIADVGTKIRVNTVDGNIATNFAGNIASGPIHISPATSMSGGSARFKGSLYSFIVRYAPSSQQEITNAESWVNGKTGAY